MHPPPPLFLLGGGGLIFIPHFQKGGLDRISIFRGELLGKREVLFSKAVQWRKKFINNFFFSIITKNLNWEILTKNLVTFKRWDGVEDEKFSYYTGSLKNMIYMGRGGGSHKKTIYRGELPKKWTWTVCRFKGVLVKEEGSVFQGGLIPQWALWYHIT